MLNFYSTCEKLCLSDVVHIYFAISGILQFSVWVAGPDNIPYFPLKFVFFLYLKYYIGLCMCFKHARVEANSPQ